MLSPSHGTSRGLGWPTSYLMQKKKTLNDVEIRIGRKTTTTGRTGVSEEKIETGKVTYYSTYFFYFLITLDFNPGKWFIFLSKITDENQRYIVLNDRIKIKKGRASVV